MCILYINVRLFSSRVLFNNIISFHIQFLRVSAFAPSSRSELECHDAPPVPRAPSCSVARAMAMLDPVAFIEASERALELGVGTPLQYSAVSEVRQRAPPSPTEHCIPLADIRSVSAIELHLGDPSEERRPRPRPIDRAEPAVNRSRRSRSVEPASQRPWEVAARCRRSRSTQRRRQRPPPPAPMPPPSKLPPAAGIAALAKRLLRLEVS